MKKLLLLLLLIWGSTFRVDAQFVQIGTDTLTSPNSIYSPILLLSGTNGNRYGRANVLLTQAELASAGLPPNATITGISFHKKNDADFGGSSIYHAIWMGNTTHSPPLSNTTTWASLIPTQTQVYVDSNYVIPTAPGWITFNFQQSFNYTGGSLSFSTEQDLQVNGPFAASIPTALRWEYTDGLADFIIGAISTSIPATLNGAVTITYRRRPNIRIHYTLGSPCVEPPVPGIAQTNKTQVCANETFNLSLSGTAFGVGLAFQWQSSPDSIVWTNVPNGNTFAVSLTQSQATQFYRCEVTCGATTVASNGVKVEALVSAFSGTYTVNPALPVTARNYQSLQDLTNQMSCVGISGPTVIEIADGTYTGNFSLSNVLGLGASTSLTIQAASSTPGSVILTNPGSGTVFTLAGISNLQLNNLTFSRTNVSAAEDALLITNSSNINVIGCVFNGLASSTSANNRLLHIANSTDINVISNTFNDGYYALFSPSVTNNAITSLNFSFNQINNIYLTPVHIVGTSSLVTISNNTINNQATVATTGHGINLTNASNFVISSNQIYGNLGITGIFISNFNATAQSPNLIFNNAISAQFASTTTPKAINFTASANDGLDFVEVAHNSFNMLVSTSSTTSNGCYYFTGGTAAAPALGGAVVLNNILRVESTLPAGTTPVNMRNYYISNGYMLDNNLIAANYNDFFFPTRTNFAAIVSPATVIASKADWTTASGQDSLSIELDPAFVSNTDLNVLPNSPVNGLGTPVSYVTTDIIGNPRSATAPDLGAYEIQAVNNNMFALDVLSPANSVSAGVAYPVNARYITLGGQTLTGVTFNYQLNNEPVVTEAYTGNHPFLDTISFTFTQSLTITAGINPILKIWTSMPNGQMDEDMSNDTLTLSLCLAIPAGTYTFGGASSDFPDVQSLMNSLNCGGVAGPVVFNAEFPGNIYEQSWTINGIPGASAVNTIIFNGNNDTLSYNAVTALRGVLILDGAKHVNIQNFTIRSVNASFGFGIQLMNGADSNAILNNTIDMRAVTATAATQSAGIVSSGTFNSNATASNASYNFISGNTILGGYYGIRLNGATGGVDAFNNIIANNEIGDFYAYGVYLSNANGSQVYGNDIHRLNRTAITTFYGVNLESGTQSTLVYDNIIHDSHTSATTITTAAYGIRVSGSSPDVNARNTFYNNLVYNLNSNGITNGALINNSSKVDMFYNTFIIDFATATGGAARGVYFQATCDSVDFRNNNIFLTKGGSGDKQGIFVENVATTLVSNKNNIFVNAPAGLAAVGNYGSGANNFVTLSDWQTANSGAYDQNSVSVDPAFVDPSQNNFVPQAGSLNGIADVITFITTDLSGQPRDAQFPDVGAYEFTPATVDASVGNISIISGGNAIPIPDGCLSSLTFPLQLEVINNGVDTLFNVSVSFRTNNQATITDTISGPLAPGSVTTYVFSQPILFTNGVDSVSAWVKVANDITAGNDSAFAVANNFLATIYQVPFSENFNSGTLPMNVCVETDANSKVEVLGTVGSNNLAIEGSHSLVMSGSASGAGWATANATNWTTINPTFNSSISYFVNADTLTRLAMSFKLRQLFRGTTLSNSFQVLVNDVPVVAEGYLSPDFRAANAAASNDTLYLYYNLDAFVGSTVKITLFTSCRYDYTGTPLHGNIIDELAIFQPTDIIYDSVTVVENTCSSGPQPIAASINSALTISAVSLNYNVNGGAYTSIPMTFSSGANTWNAILPAQAAGDTVGYFVAATNSAGTFNSDTLSYREVYLFFDLGPDQTINPGDSITLRSGITFGSTSNNLFTGAANNGSGAVMFEVQSTENISINAFEVYMSSTVQYTLDVYVKTGTMTGFENNPAAWTLVNTVSLTGAGTTTPVRVNLPNNINIPANQLHGIYIFGAGIRYIGNATTPATVGQVWSSDSTLTVYGGIGGGTLFSGSANQGRTFGGTIHYLTQDSIVWTDGVNVLGNADTLRVGPSTTTLYHCSVFDANCSYTDSVTVFVNPLTDVCVNSVSIPTNAPQIGQSYPVSATIKNCGNTAISNFDVSYSVNGTNLNSNTIQSTLQPGDSILHVFTLSWNPTTGGLNRLCAYVSQLAGSNNTANDTACVNFLNVSTQDINNLVNRIYPNPANDKVTIELKEMNSAASKLILLDPLGKQVKLLEIPANVQIIQLEVFDLAPGLYSYRIESKNQTGVGKLVITR